MCSCLWQAATRLPKNKVRATIPSWTLKLSDFKQEKRKVTCFFFSFPSELIHSPKLCWWPHHPQLCAPSPPTPQVPGDHIWCGALLPGADTSGGSCLWKWWVFCKPLLLLLMQPSGREVISDFVPWEVVALWSSYSKDLQGRTVRSGLVFQVLFLFSHLHSWAISDLTL